MTSDHAVPAFSLQDPTLNWQALTHASPPPERRWRSWLEDPGSLTAKLKARSACHFRVKVLQEGWVELNQAALRQRFGPVASSRRFWSRQVCLLGLDQPWVLAHTLIAETSLQGPLQVLRTLDEKPLGEYLFQQPDLRRGELEIARLQEAWARRTVFNLRQQPIMVAEAFLPDLLAFKPSSNLSAGGL